MHSRSDICITWNERIHIMIDSFDIYLRGSEYHIPPHNHKRELLYAQVCTTYEPLVYPPKHTIVIRFCHGLNTSVGYHSSVIGLKLISDVIHVLTTCTTTWTIRRSEEGGVPAVYIISLIIHRRGPAKAGRWAEMMYVLYQHHHSSSHPACRRRRKLHPNFAARTTSRWTSNIDHRLVDTIAAWGVS